MLFQKIYKFILRRPFFKGQDRLFSYLFKKNKLNQGWQTVKPLQNSFIINCDTATWIGAKIVYTGDYETAFKEVVKSFLKKGDYVLDIGANIGFHTLFFAEIVGEQGKVTAFEPVPYNYQALQHNISLNNFSHITAMNIALSHKNEQIYIAADEKSINPGTFNLFDQSGNTLITCCIGDEITGDQKVDFMKIDVEGYESFVIQGLLETIKKNRPTIIFEYDKGYHQKTGLTEDYIFSLLSAMNYHFFHIYQAGPARLNSFTNLESGNILALPNA